MRQYTPFISFRMCRTCSFFLHQRKVKYFMFDFFCFSVNIETESGARLLPAGAGREARTAHTPGPPGNGASVQWAEQVQDPSEPAGVRCVSISVLSRAASVEQSGLKESRCCGHCHQYIMVSRPISVRVFFFSTHLKQIKWEHRIRAPPIALQASLLQRLAWVPCSKNSSLFPFSAVFQK